MLDHHHEPVPHAPRNMLKRQIARLAAKGMKAFCASELEFYLFTDTYASAEAKREAEITARLSVLKVAISSVRIACN